MKINIYYPKFINENKLFISSSMWNCQSFILAKLISFYFYVQPWTDFKQEEEFLCLTTNLSREHFSYMKSTQDTCGIEVRFFERLLQIQNNAQLIQFP